MPDTQVQPSTNDLPTPVAITPALLKLHNLTDDEYALIHTALGRTPSLTELGIYSVMWSEHCSYKSSKVHLKRLPTKSDLVVQGPGENAGIIDVGDGWACAFKIESHNHPSYIEPYQGAATGVGGIRRDIFTMGARPLAVMDSLRFGPLDATSLKEPDFSPANSDSRINGALAPEVTPSEAAKNRQIMEGVVHGVAGYGNCFGVPNLGGETRFEPCYSGNPLLNAFALGLVRMDEIFYAKATGVGNPVIYVGAKTGRDGIHGATMASEEFTEGSEQKRPNVQMGDPFLEKLLLEACLEVMHLPSKAVLGIQDMGAAGLTCSICEMGARGGVGLDVELTRVPQRETGMTSYEIMLSESQERMLLVAELGKEQEILDIFAKWGLDAAIVGHVIAENRMKIRHHGELVADLSNESLTDDAPLYHRPIGVWKAPIPLDPPDWVLEELKRPRDYTADLKQLLASANICDKSYIFEQYDSMVQTNTVQGPGAEAGVMRIKGTGIGSREQETASFAPNAAAPGQNASPGIDSLKGPGFSPANSSTPQKEALATEATSPLTTNNLQPTTAKPERGLAMALAGNGRWTYLNPKLGAMHAVAEAARKVACTGAKPVAATNCLNFGNPMKPEIMAQLSEAIDGIAEACTALGTPITGGNVSLYNETNGEGIYPTPVIGIVGILDDVTKSVPNSFQTIGDTIFFLSSIRGEGRQFLQDMGATAYAQSQKLSLWGAPPVLNLHEERILQDALQAAADQRLLASACDLSDGGFATALARACFPNSLGAAVTMQLNPATPISIKERLFSEVGSSTLVSVKTENIDAFQHLIQKHPGVWASAIGQVAADSLQILINGDPIITSATSNLKSAWSETLAHITTDAEVAA